jgi:hypothetical protein
LKLIDCAAIRISSISRRQGLIRANPAGTKSPGVLRRLERRAFLAKAPTRAAAPVVLKPAPRYSLQGMWHARLQFVGDPADERQAGAVSCSKPWHSVFMQSAIETHGAGRNGLYGGDAQPALNTCVSQCAGDLRLTNIRVVAAISQACASATMTFLLC